MGILKFERNSTYQVEFNVNDTFLSNDPLVIAFYLYVFFCIMLPFICFTVPLNLNCILFKMNQP